jgi:hypothetical protein
VGPWQRQLNELGGVKPLAFGQYGELGPGPGFEQLLDLDQLARNSRNKSGPGSSSSSSTQSGSLGQLERAGRAASELGAEAAAVRSPLLCVSPIHQNKI